MKKLGIGILALVAALSFTTSARAVLVDFNGGAAGGQVDVGSLDWNVSSFLAQGGVQAIANFASNPACPTTSCQFTVATMAQLSGVNNTNGVNQNPTGLNTDYQITFVAKFTETVTAVGSNSAQFATVTSAPVILEIYYDTNLNVNPLNGSGFNDGRLILSATAIANSAGSFEKELNLRQLTAGVYLLVITTDKGEQNMQRLVIEK